MSGETESTCCLSIPPQIVWRDVEGDLVLFDARREQYHTLNASASFVWRGIAHGDTMTAIIAQATASDPGQADAIAKDVHAFVESALRLGLLHE